MPSKWIAALLLCSLSSASFAVTQGDLAPPWSGYDMASDSVVEFPELLDGKPAVIIFWATWCPYCKAFMPYAKEIQRDYATHGVQIITFNAKERGIGDPQAYVDSLGFPLVAIAEADPIADEYDIPFIPGLMVVDENGLIVYRRKSTDLPAGKTVSQLWDSEVRQTLDSLIEN